MSGPISGSASIMAIHGDMFQDHVVLAGFPGELHRSTLREGHDVACACLAVYAMQPFRQQFTIFSSRRTALLSNLSSLDGVEFVGPL